MKQPNPYYLTIGAKLKVLRKSKKLELPIASKDAGIKLSKLKKIEAGTCVTFDLEEFYRICSVYDVHPAIVI